MRRKKKKKKSWWREIRWVCNSFLTWDSRKMYVKFSNTGFWARELQVHSSLYVSCGHAKLSGDPSAPHQEHKQPEVVRVLSHGGGWWMHRWDMEEVCKMDNLSRDEIKLTHHHDLLIVLKCDEMQIVSYFYERRGRGLPFTAKILFQNLR